MTADAMAARTAALETAVAEMRALHKEFKIWDQCDCKVDYIDYIESVTSPDGHTYVNDVGWTCSYMYSICRECCCDDDYQTEDCATYHNHNEGLAICPTVAILEGHGL